MAPRTAHVDMGQNDSDSEFDTEAPFYTVNSIRRFARKRFPYAVQLLPGPDDIKYHIQDVTPSSSDYQLGIKIGHIREAGQLREVSAIMALAGDVSLYQTDEKKILSRRERANIEFITPWDHLKRGKNRTRLRKVCALSAWYLMIHNCGVFEVSRR